MPWMPCPGSGRMSCRTSFTSAPGICCAMHGNTMWMSSWSVTIKTRNRASVSGNRITRPLSPSLMKNCAGASVPWRRSCRSRSWNRKKLYIKGQPPGPGWPPGLPGGPETGNRFFRQAHPARAVPQLRWDSPERGRERGREHHKEVVPGSV